MNSSAQSSGAAVVCDLAGVIQRIAHDHIGFSQTAFAGAAFVELVEQGSMDKAARFIQTIARHGAAYDWQLDLQIENNVSTFLCMGCRDQDQLWIILAKNQNDAARIIDEMCSIHNEQATTLRSTLKQAASQSKPISDESLFNDMMGMHNELARVQRELAQRNAQLESLQATLQARQKELLEANARLDTLATTDELTGIANRRTFMERLEMEADRTKRHNHPLSLILLDIDHFKHYNDTFGHPEGDTILRLMGRLLRETLRSSDLAARYGGEELAVLLINTPKAQAMDMAERLRQRIATSNWPHPGITVSLGVSTLNSLATDAAELIKQADLALYASKHRGRNRCTHHQELPSAEESRLSPPEAS